MGVRVFGLLALLLLLVLPGVAQAQSGETVTLAVSVGGSDNQSGFVAGRYGSLRPTSFTVGGVINSWRGVYYEPAVGRLVLEPQAPITATLESVEIQGITTLTDCAGGPTSFNCSFPDLPWVVGNGHTLTLTFLPAAQPAEPDLRIPTAVPPQPEYPPVPGAFERRYLVGAGLTPGAPFPVSGLWSNGDTTWVAYGANVVNTHDGLLWGFDPSGIREPGRDIDISGVICYAVGCGEYPLGGGSNAYITGIWSDGTTLWVANTQRGYIYAFRLSDGARLRTLDRMIERTTTTSGMWVIGETLYIVDSGGSILAYPWEGSGSLTPITGLAIDISSLTLLLRTGIASNGSTIWVSTAATLAAFALDGTREAINDVLLQASNTLPSAVGYSAPNDLARLSVANVTDRRVYDYNSTVIAAPAPVFPQPPPIIGDVELFPSAAADALYLNWLPTASTRPTSGASNVAFLEWRIRGQIVGELSKLVPPVPNEATIDGIPNTVPHTMTLDVRWLWTNLTGANLSYPESSPGAGDGFELEPMQRSYSQWSGTYIVSVGGQSASRGVELGPEVRGGDGPFVDLAADFMTTAGEDPGSAQGIARIFMPLTLVAVALGLAVLVAGTAMSFSPRVSPGIYFAASALGSMFFIGAMLFGAPLFGMDYAMATILALIIPSLFLGLTIIRSIRA